MTKLEIILEGAKRCCRGEGLDDEEKGYRASEAVLGTRRKDRRAR